MLNTSFSNTQSRIVERFATVIIAVSISLAMIAETVSVPLSF